METLGSGAAVLDLLFQIGSYRSILFDFGTDISTWTFEFYLKKNKGDRLKTLSLTLGSGLSFPVYESDQIQAIFSTSNTSIEEGQYYYELRRTDIALPLINGFAYFSFDAPQGTIDDTTLELTVSQQTISVTISNISDVLDHFRGVYATLIALQAAVPTGNAGDYADVDAGVGTDIQRYIWDVDDAEWILGGGGDKVPQSRELTINGVTYDLSQDREWTVSAGSSVEVLVDDYGSIVSGVTDCSAIIDLAIAAAGPKGILKFTPGKTYIIDEKVTWPIAMLVLGYGAHAIRKDAIYSTLASSASLNDTTLQVTSADGFKIGDDVICCDVTLPYGGRGYNENSQVGTAPQVITNIVGTTITVSPGIGKAMPSGSTFVKVYDMFDGAQSTANTSGLGTKIFGLEFDGNRANNNHTNSWVFNKCIDNLPTQSVIQDCVFHDMPGENIFISNNTALVNNRAYDLNGSFVHISQASSPNTGTNMIYGNKAKRICLATNDVTDHSEGFITFSVSPQKMFVHNNEVQDCSEAFIAPISDFSNNLSIIGNKAFNCNGVSSFYNFSVVSEKLIMTDNVFDNCAFLFVEANVGGSNDDFVQDDRGQDHHIISDNIFTNVKAFITRSSSFEIRGNKFITKRDHVYSTTDAVSGFDASLTITKSTHYSIKNNTFDNRVVAQDQKLLKAISCEDGALYVLKEYPSTDTEYSYYNRNVEISGNKILNYTYGILDHFGSDGLDFERTLSTMGFTIKNNNITLREDILARYGIVAGPGCIVKDNEVYGPGTAGVTRAGIVALGVNDGSGATYTGDARLRLNGAIVKNNLVVGMPTSIIVGNLGGDAGDNSYNAIVRFNDVDGTVVDNSSTNSTVSDNTTLVDEDLNIQIVRQDPVEPPPSYNALVNEWLAQGTADGGTPQSDAHLTALSTFLETPLSTGTVESRMKTGYILHTGSKEFAKLNLKDVSTYKLIESGTVMATAGSGCKSASSSYFRQPLKSDAFTGDQLTFIQYMPEDNPTQALITSHGFNVRNAGGGFTKNQPFRLATSGRGAVAGATNTNHTNSNFKGLYGQTHTGTNYVMYLDEAKTSTAVALVTPNISIDRIILGMNNGTSTGAVLAQEFFTEDISVDFVFDQFNDADWLAIRIAFNTYKTAVGLP